MLVSFISMAQIKLYLHKKDGSIIEYIAAEIDSITLSLYDVPGNPENPEVPPVVPSDSVVVEKISFDSLTSGMYYLMAYVDRYIYWGLQELTSDELIVPIRYMGDWDDDRQYIELHNHNFDYRRRRDSWHFLMNGINQCDGLIAKIANDEVKDCTEENLAELYIYRSWFQYLMLDSFGDIQYNGKELSRTEAFDSIITDLLTYVPKASIEKDYGRVNRSVGWMILSKMYLNAEAWNVAGIANFAKSAQDCYRISAAFADSIIIKGGYSLESDYFTNFKVDNQISKENIWSILCEESYGDGLEFHNLTHHYALKDKYGMKEQPWNGYCTTHKVIGIYEVGDRRIETWARGQQYDKKDSVIKISVGIDESAYMKMPIYVRKPNSWPYNLEAFKLMNAGLYSINFDFPVYYTDTITTLTNTDNYKVFNVFEGARFNKFEIRESVGNYMSNDFPIYRLADVYLMKAEALMRANGGATLEAVEAANIVRARAGASMYTTTTLTLDELSNERCRELSWEGHRRQDLIRFNRFTGANSVPNDNDPANLWILKESVSDESKKIFSKEDINTTIVAFSGIGEEMNVGDVVTLEKSISGILGELIWSSSDERVATVDQNGTVVALAQGEVTITANVNGYSASQKINVVIPIVPLPFEDVPEEATPTEEETTLMFQIENASCDEFELYLMGIDGEWGDRPEMKFERVEDTQDWFKITVPALDERQYNFKIRANGNWSYEPKKGYLFYGKTNDYVDDFADLGSYKNNLMVIKSARGQILAFKVVDFYSICDKSNDDIPNDDVPSGDISDEEEVEETFDYIASGLYNGYEYVDLGLPSGILWATCNVGADSPLGYGAHFAWGETVPKEEYSLSTYKWYDEGYTKYCAGNFIYFDVCKVEDNKTDLELSDDAANANLGGGWRMPTLKEIQELVKNCTWDWKSINGVKGHVITGKNGNTIFLPAAACSGYDVNSFGNYWTSTQDSIYSDAAYVLDNSQEEVISDRGAFYLRDYGRSVRPVISKDDLSISPEEPSDSIDYVVSGYENSYGYVDLGLPSGTFWATCNVGADSPVERGDYFAWGETEPKGTYNWSTYKWMTEGMSAWAGITKYTYPDNQKEYNKDVVWYDDNKVFIGDNNKELDLEDDAANYYWGGNWSTPTSNNIEELMNPENCEWVLDTINNIHVIKIVSKRNGNYIILPFAGYMEENENRSNTTAGYIWGKDLSVYSGAAYCMYYHDVAINLSNYYPRSLGMSIRPVLLSETELPDLGTYTISFDANGGSGEIQPSELEESTIYMIPENTFIRDDYEFIAWNTQADGTGTTYFVNDVLTITSDITLYAQWKYIYQETGNSNGYGYVDLGLPSGTLWATCNVGADSPVERGDYFAWGETEPKGTYNWGNYKLSQGNHYSITKYNSSDNKVSLELVDDVANVNWGGEWRMPSVDDFKELCASDYCIWETKYKNGIFGFEVRSKINNNVIFLPATGYCNDNTIYHNTESGYYWSSDLTEYTELYVSTFAINNSGSFWPTSDRAYGMCVRPVLKGETSTPSGILPYTPSSPTGFENGYGYVDLGLPSGTLWAVNNIGATSSEEFGDYFAWGETETKKTFSAENYKWSNSTYDYLSKYCTDSSLGEVDSKVRLEIEDDAASANWGGEWRIPTCEEFEELCTNCIWTYWTTRNGINGYKITSKVNGNSIYMPTTGYYEGSTMCNRSSHGFYWSSSLNSLNNKETYVLEYSLGNIYFRGDVCRYFGHAIRPVLNAR